MDSDLTNNLLDLTYDPEMPVDEGVTARCVRVVKVFSLQIRRILFVCCLHYFVYEMLLRVSTVISV